MPSDSNSLPRSPTTSASPFQLRTMQSSEDTPPSPPPRSSSVSLQAAATINAADLSRNSSTRSPQANRAAERRRSVVAMNLNLNDPTIPGPGELSCSDHRSSLRGSSTHSPTAFCASPGTSGDPYHHRTPSLGEIHQELEQEQEAQVNRLLLMIRNQQAQLQQLQQQNAGNNGNGAVDDSTPTSERSTSFSSFPPLPRPPSSHRRRSSLHLPNLRSRRNSSTYMAGPQSEISLTSSDWVALGSDGTGRRDSRDESAFYQAETASLTRENQMLRLRIRELEKQLGELTASSPHTPAAPSNLTSSTSAESLSPPAAAAESQPSSRESGNE